MAENSRGGNESGDGKPIFRFDDDSGETGGNGNVPPVTSGTVDPASLAGNARENAGTDSGRKQRSDKGKQRGPRQGKGASAQPLDLSGIQFALFGIHTMLASSLHVPELELTQGEAEQLSKAIANVAAYYPVAVDPKTMAWLGLITIAGSLYGSRAVAYYARINTKPGRAVDPTEGNVTPFKPVA